MNVAIVGVAVDVARAWKPFTGKQFDLMVVVSKSRINEEPV